ncbi:hypothetical protein QYF36_015988 [Acer negundo]|nr:hypothetical protein QYF36_015988 [Acer negundo]
MVQKISKNGYMKIPWSPHSYGTVWNMLLLRLLCGLRLLRSCGILFMNVSVNPKNASLIYDVYSSFFSCQQDDKSLSEHIGSIKSLWGELNSYHHVTIDKNLLQKQRQELLVVRFLSSLNPMYESAKNNILTEKELQTIKEVYGHLKRLSLNPSSTQESSTLLSFGGLGRGQPSGRDQGSSHQPTIGNQSTRMPSTLPIASLAQTGSSLESSQLSPYPPILFPVVPTTQPDKPLQVYQRQKNLPPPEVDRQGNSTPSDQAPIQESTSNRDPSTCNEKIDLDIPIAIRKGQRSTVRYKSSSTKFAQKVFGCLAGNMVQSNLKTAL